MATDSTYRPQPSSAPPTVQPPSHQEIADRAFSVYLARGASEGEDLSDWLHAERELLLERSQAALAGSDDTAAHPWDDDAA